METRDILYISSIPWDFSWHRQQEMMSKLAERGYRILFLEPFDKRKPFKSGTKNPEKNIWCLSIPGLPYERCIKISNVINGFISKRYIKKELSKLNFRNPIVWFDRVHGVNLDFLFGFNRVVYDLIDEILAFGRYRNERMLLNIENRVLNRADLLVSSSQTLLKRKLKQSGRQSENNMFLPNGVDVSRFMSKEAIKTGTAMTSQPFPASVCDGIPKPQIGFVGHISRRSLNYNIIEASAKALPDCSFVFIGPGTQEDKKSLKMTDNIYVLDAVSGEDVPNVIMSFDVGIIPYNIEKQDMDYVFPRKACEYLACGIPVVSTALAEIYGLESQVLIATSEREFTQMIKDALINKADSDEYISFAKKYDWDYLLKELVEKI